MIVKDLIDKLNKLDQDKEIFIYDDNGLMIQEFFYINHESNVESHSNDNGCVNRDDCYVMYGVYDEEDSIEETTYIGK